jgi:hypothetical protein
MDKIKEVVDRVADSGGSQEEALNAVMNELNLEQLLTGTILEPLKLNDTIKEMVDKSVQPNSLLTQIVQAIDFDALFKGVLGEAKDKIAKYIPGDFIKKILSKVTGEL